LNYNSFTESIISLASENKSLTLEYLKYESIIFLAIAYIASINKIHYNKLVEYNDLSKNKEDLVPCFCIMPISDLCIVWYCKFAFPNLIGTHKNNYLNRLSVN